MTHCLLSLSIPSFSSADISILNRRQSVLCIWEWTCMTGYTWPARFLPNSGPLTQDIWKVPVFLSLAHPWNEARSRRKHSSPSPQNLPQVSAWIGGIISLWKNQQSEWDTSLPITSQLPVSAWDVMFFLLCDTFRTQLGAPLHVQVSSKWSPNRS